MIKAVIFDLDGLLVDTEGLWDQTNIEFIRSKGFKCGQDVNDEVRGSGQRQVTEYFKKRYGITGDTEELVRQRRELFYSLAKNNLKLLKGAGEIVRGLSEKGYLLAIATGGHTKEKTEYIISSLGLEKYFKFLISSDQVEKDKPEPDVYLYTASLLGIKASECLVLEDAANGAIAGKKAGMTVFGVNKDNKLREQLIEAGADKVFFDLLEVLEFINK